MEMTNTISTDPLLQYGVLGFFSVLMLSLIWVLFKRLNDTLDREVARGDKYEELLRQQYQYNQDTLLPATINLANLTKELMGTTKSMIELEAQKRILEQR